MKVTFIVVLENCDSLIDNFIFNFNKLKNFNLHHMIIKNIINTNSKETNKKIFNFVTKYLNIKLINCKKNNFINIYESYNKLIEQVDTELVCCVNQQDKILPDFISIIKVFNEDIDLVTSTLCLHDENHYFISYLNHIKTILVNSKVYNDSHEYKIKQNKKSKVIKVKTNEFDLIDMFFYSNKLNNIYLNSINNLVGCCPIWKKKLFDDYGGFNLDEFKDITYFELWCRYLSNGAKMKSLDQRVVYTYTKNNISNKSQIKKIINLYHPYKNFLKF